MAAQIRNLKARHHQQRLYIEKLKQENAELKRMNDMLQAQSQYQDTDPYQQDGYENRSMQYANTNGKRPRMDSMKSPIMSSPRRTSPPIGVTRLTLPPGQKPPQLAAKTHEVRESIDDAAHRRPGSSQFAQQYAYAPQSSHIQPSHIPRQQLSSRRGKPPTEQPAQRTHSSQLMPPPQAPARTVFNPRSSTHSKSPANQQVIPQMNSRRNPDLPSTSHRLPQQAYPYIPEAPGTSQGPSNISSNRFLPHEHQTSRFPRESI
ncbi:hypothetical protein VNI00_003254 [Paramarasmius palmivorus]|uniref:Uncharacterized protein n=1 Tax=Paramarasmius palmivorus TaxID=297713 RepID=A0AAW0DQC3_9AGAR